MNYITAGSGATLPVAGFVASPTSGTSPLAVQFTDQSTGGPASWRWDFGDGGSSFQINPGHTYTASGSYTVRLTVSNLGGETTVTKTNYIVVNQQSASDYFCTSVTVEVGKWKSGDHTSLHASDDSYLTTKAKKLEGKFSDQVSYVFDTGLGSLSSLSITSEAHPKVAPVRQRVYLFNPSTGEWESVDDRGIDSKDEATLVIGVSSPSRYLSASGQVRVRITTGDFVGKKWKHFIDLVKLTAAP